MIMPYDPFDQDHMIYTIKTHCEQLPKMPYEDGARTIFLYTKGTKGKASKELRQMLRYFEHTIQENAESRPLKELHQMVDRVRRDKEVSTEYMLWSERKLLWQEEARDEMREENRLKIEAERQRADAALKENEALKKELEQLRAKLAETGR